MSEPPESKGASANERLIAAARADDDEAIATIFEKEEHDVNFQDGIGNTALHYAAKGGNIAAMEQLLSHDKCDVDLQNRIDKDTPLHLALKIEDDEKLKKDTVESLLDAGADTTIKNKYGATAFNSVPDNSELKKLMVKARAEAALDRDRNRGDFASDDDDDGEPGSGSDSD